MTQSSHEPKLIRFGVFDVDLQTGQLHKAGVRVKLQEQPFQILAALLEHPGAVVTRAELRQRLWPADTFVDFDLSLNGALKKLRFALGDDATNPLFIETIPRRGYRFIANVTSVPRDFVERPEPTPATPSVMAGEARTNSALPRLLKSRAAKICAVALAVSLFIFASTQVWRLRPPSKTAAQVNVRSLAVLPLENLSGDPSQDYFADGMTDELITRLGQISSLRVISRTSVMQYKSSRKPLPQIAGELGVDAIVEGTVLKSADQVRITAQLIQGTAEKHLWAESYQGNLRDVLGLQNQVANAIAKQIQTTLGPRNQIRPGIEPPVNPDAYESYLKGEYLLNRFTQDSIRDAAEYFQKAIDQDPGYAPAYSKLAGCYQMLGNMGAIPNKVARPKAKLLVAKALDLDPQFAAAHAVRGWGLLEYELDFVTAGQEFEKSIQLNPNGVEGHHGMGDYYASLGKVQESVQEMEFARQLDPLALIVNTDLCRMLYFARRFDEALAQCKANLELDSSPRALWMLGDVYAAKRMDAEAVSTFMQALHAAKAPDSMIAAAEAGATDTGVKGYWKTLVRFVPENVANGNLNAFDVAVVYAYAGDTDKTLAWLEKAVEGRCYGIVYLGINPIFDGVRSDPRFLALLGRMNLSQLS
jgi:TolB-like protein/DNA-binding winged helix-turn-helix (wHTH) protein/Tfp pilus assembly protein PilF